MATSSIFKTFVIKGKEEVEAFVNLLDSEPEPIEPNARLLTDPKEIETLFIRLKKGVERLEAEERLKEANYGQE